MKLTTFSGKVQVSGVGCQRHPRCHS